MPRYNTDMREEEIKNRLRQDYFSHYDPSPILGNVDFAVAVPTPQGQPQLFETEYLLWAEAKKGNHANVNESLVQLILTIGRARTFDRHLPPAFLGAFDAEKIAFLPYYKVLDVFNQNDFNWNVAPSDHSSREFRQLLALVADTLDRETLIFSYDHDDRELRLFIRQNFIVGKSRLSKVRISKNNFTAIYQKWRREVMPTIVVNWDIAKRQGIIDADFYLADILSEHNATLKDKLYVLLRQDHYELDRKIDSMGLYDSKQAQFSDKQKAHNAFWNRYNRPPRREYWDYIVERRDLLVPQDVRERRGSYFTPQQWVELSQQYLALELGDDWQDQYAVWDCCAGTGNLLVGLANKWNVYASTLDQADVDVMRDRIRNGAALLDSHVFQFDFLNDPLLDEPERGIKSKLPQSLQEIIRDPERRKKLVIYINPPYAEAGNIKQLSGNGQNKSGTAINHLMYSKYKPLIRQTASELFALFFIRIYKEIPNSFLAEFSTLKILQAPNFATFRDQFRAKLGRLFLVPANTFDNVKGQFPIGFFIWETCEHETFEHIEADVYDSNGMLVGKKTIFAPDADSKPISRWLISHNSAPNEQVIGNLNSGRNDFQNQNLVYIANFISSEKSQHATFRFSSSNITIGCIFFAVRHCIEATWLNDRDQFLFPNDGWQTDTEFQADCLVYTLFHGQNRISSVGGVNHWIPFTEAEVDAKEAFKSHFMSDYLSGKAPSAAQGGATIATPQDLFANNSSLHTPHSLKESSSLSEAMSEAALATMSAGRALWSYYHQQPDANPDASFYDIRLHFQGTKLTKGGKQQMNADSPDPRYTELIAQLRQSLKALARKIEPKVYEYGFQKR